MFARALIISSEHIVVIITQETNAVGSHAISKNSRMYGNLLDRFPVWVCGRLGCVCVGGGGGWWGRVGVGVGVGGSGCICEIVA